jgi:hypothetical protein
LHDYVFNCLVTPNAAHIGHEKFKDGSLAGPQLGKQLRHVTIYCDRYRNSEPVAPNPGGTGKENQPAFV